MTIAYGFKPSGCFVVRDTGRPWWALSFATSPNAEAAKRDPEGTAKRMAILADGDMRLLAKQSKKFRDENLDRWEILSRYTTSIIAA